MTEAPKKLTPKVMIITMYHNEARKWIAADSVINLSGKIALSGLSRGYGDVYHNDDGSVCLLITGVALVNAALTVAALISSDAFDLSKTYFVLSGIAGVNPKKATIGSVAFAKFAVQLDTQLVFDAREIPSDWSTGWVPMGADSIDSYPKHLTGTEVYELSDVLRQEAIAFARDIELADSDRAKQYRTRFAGSPNNNNNEYDAAARGPTMVEGDVVSANPFWHGTLLAEAMARATKLYTNNKAEYVMTAQEDTAILTALLRAAMQGQVSFSRILLMRAASNFDRQPPGAGSPSLPFDLDASGGLEPALENLYLIGVKVVQGIVQGWDDRFERGLKDENYVGDIFASLGGDPDFLPGDVKSALVQL